MKFINLIAMLALAGAVFAGLSSDQALELVGGKKGFLNEGESAKLLLPTPLEVEGERYWIAYFYQTAAPDTKNLFVAVSDNTGLVERDAAKLTPIFSIAHKYNTLELLKSGKASLDDIEIFMTESEKLRQGAEEKFFSTVRQQLEIKYPEVSFREIEANLQEVKGKQERVRDSISEARSLKSQFEIYGTASDFDNYFYAYNATYGEINSLAKSVDKYQASILSKVDEVTNSPSMNFSSKQEIKQALEQLYDLGDYRSFRAGVVEPALRTVSTQLSRAPQFVNNSVESALYRIARKEAEHSYAPELISRASTLLSQSRETELRFCGVETGGLKRKWGDVRSVMENPANATRGAYEQVPSKISEVQGLVNEAENKLADCTVAPTPKPKPAADNATIINTLILLLVIVLAYYAYLRYKKWREEES